MFACVVQGGISMISHRLGATAHRVCPGGHTSQFYAGRSIPSIGPKASTGRSRDLATRIQGVVWKVR